MVPGRFDDVLTLIEDAQAREAITKTLEGSPAAKAALQKLDVLANDGKVYNEWHQNPQGWKLYEERFAKFPQLTSDLEAANAKIAELTGAKPPADQNANGGEKVELGDMTLEQLEQRFEQRMAAKGFVTRAEAERMADEKARAAAAGVETRIYTHGLIQVENMEDAKRNYQTEFGKTLDRTAFGKFITEGKYASVEMAYKAYTEQDRLDKVKADAFAQGQAEGDKKAREALAKEGAESAMRGLPTDMNGTHGFVSHPGAPPTPVAMKDIPADYQLGARGGFKLAHAVAAQIEADRAAGKVV